LSTGSILVFAVRKSQQHMGDKKSLVFTHKRQHRDRERARADLRAEDPFSYV